MPRAQRLLELLLKQDPRTFHLFSELFSPSRIRVGGNWARARQVMTWTSDHCPISDEPAQEALPRDGDFAEFNCPTCGRFRIAISSLKKIRNYARDDRTALLYQAVRNAPKDAIPVVRDID